MSFLKFNPLSTPSRFEFKDPDVPNKTYKADSYQSLYKLIRGYRSQNELPEIPYLEVVVEHYLCSLPENKGRCLPRPKLKRGLIPTIRGGIALIASVLYSSFVPQSKADERSAICAKCPHNIFPDKGPFIKWSDDIAEAAVGKRKSKYHDKIGNCQICSCPLRAKVWYNGKLEFSEEQLEKFPEFCWQKKEAINGNK
jgi:hypothetical protein